MSDSLQLHGLQPANAPLSMGFPRQEYWSGLPFSSPGDFNYPNIYKLPFQYVNNVKTKVFRFLHCLQILMSIYTYSLFIYFNPNQPYFKGLVTKASSKLCCQCSFNLGFFRKISVQCLQQKLSSANTASTPFIKVTVSKESACNAGDGGFDPWVGKIPWRKEWQPIPAFLPGKCHGQRSLAGFSPLGRKGLDVTKALSRADQNETTLKLEFLPIKTTNSFILSEFRISVDEQKSGEECLTVYKTHS